MSKEHELIFKNGSNAIFGKEKLLVPVENLNDMLEFLRKIK
jgi:hypothetical protein